MDVIRLTLYAVSNYMKTLRIISAIILIVLCISACYGSYHMINDPSGHSLELPFYLLYETIFNNYQSIGWILLIVFGVLSFFILIMMLLRSRFYSFFIILQGVLLCIFIFVQLLLLNTIFWIQYLYLAFGVALIYLGVLQKPA